MSDNFGKSNGIFDSGRFMPGESWSYTFENFGTFSYYCTIHPWMEDPTIDLLIYFYLAYIVTKEILTFY